MNVRRVRFWLWTIGASMLAAAAGGFARLVTMPLAQPGSFAASTAGPSTRRASEESSVPTLRSFQPHWSLDLRRPLYDPPPAVKAEAPKPPPPPLAVKLAGTVIEPGYSRALLTVADGKTELKAVGEKVGGVEVLTIEPDCVTVMHNDKPVVLKLATKEKSSP